MLMKNSFFWDMMLYTLVHGYHHLEGHAASFFRVVQEECDLLAMSFSK
jgi:hypothetical protein